MNKKIIFGVVVVMVLCNCTNLTRQEQLQLQRLKGQGITVDKPAGTWERPANRADFSALFYSLYVFNLCLL